MAGSHPLCDYCAQIPFLAMPASGRYGLGSWSRICASHCRFCQLVKYAYCESYRTDPRQRTLLSSDVIVSWGENYSYFERPAFRIHGLNSAYLRPFVEAELDISRVSHWISTCATTHGNHCTLDDASFASAFPGLHVLRLIDVMQHCLVETQEFHRYVALSYIWGASLFAACSTRPGEGVDVMDQIYERAWLTIFAATGTDANAGLPGVQVGSRRPANLVLEVQPGILLGVCAGLDRLLEGSMYSSRGWTFQEHVLSRRGLYSVDNKVFFRCRTSEFLESCIDCDNATPRFKGIVLSLSAAAYMDDPLQNYSQLLTHYTRRALTDPGDVLRAMAGIIRRISEKVEYRFVQGLPSGAFDSFIIFESWACILRRRKGFPSYSWCGWQGGIWLDILHDNSEWLSKTWIIWYKRSQSGITNLVSDPAANDSFPFHDTPYLGYRRRHMFKPPAPLGFATTRTAPTETIHLPGPVPPYPVLQFWALAVYMKLSHVDVFDGRCELVGKSGAKCGETLLDGFEDTDFFSSKEPLEFILLSYGDEQHDTGDDYHVMLLEHNQGLAERRGMGQDRESRLMFVGASIKAHRPESSIFFLLLHPSAPGNLPIFTSLVAMKTVPNTLARRGGANTMKTMTSSRVYKTRSLQNTRARRHDKDTSQTPKPRAGSESVEDCVSPTNEQAAVQVEGQSSVAPKPSPFSDFLRPTPRECKTAHDILEGLHGDAVREILTAPDAPAEDYPYAMDALVVAALSQATSWSNARRAMQSMKEIYGSPFAYSSIVKGGTDKLVDALRPGGMQNRKAKILMTLLKDVKAKHGKWDLQHLFTKSDDEVIAEHLSQKGRVCCRYSRISALGALGMETSHSDQIDGAGPSGRQDTE
ncbi:hypothetical protein MRS44_005701 [Fusarium solani]|uniref:uncharacterized protein n=1 Tax=Fusarium solani TaxID=169388 RepID=UPI0032C3E9AC|nr:hypothetical protein MRS44_005701 [Fusarium solani]